MDRGVQKPVVYAVFGLLLLATVWVECGSVPTRIWPVLDRPGACAYCRAVEEAFAGAEHSIDLLLSNAQVDENPLWETLLVAAARGVQVRVLLDASDWAPEITEKNRTAADLLSAAGISVRFDDPEVTTHAKLVIIDRREVVLGSSNWNRHAFTDQEQANVRVQDERVGTAFSEYFDRLWDDEGAPWRATIDVDRLDGEDPLLVAIPDAEGSCLYATVLLELLRRATRSIYVVMYRLSRYPTFPDSLSNRILDALCAAVGRGVDVRVLVDDCAFYEASAEANLEAALYLWMHGVDVRLDDPAETTHSKLVVIDGETVILGSTNWNYYALERNVETDLAVVRVPALAEAFEAHFAVLWGAGRRPGP